MTLCDGVMWLLMVVSGRTRCPRYFRLSLQILRWVVRRVRENILMLLKELRGLNIQSKGLALNFQYRN